MRPVGRDRANHLKRVRAKLGVHRQMELAGLISGLVLPLHTGDGPALRDR